MGLEMRDSKLEVFWRGMTEEKRLEVVRGLNGRPPLKETKSWRGQKKFGKCNRLTCLHYLMQVKYIAKATRPSSSVATHAPLWNARQVPTGLRTKRVVKVVT